MASTRRVHVGVRLQMGPAGGRGAPGRTPRRCYRGLLGTYALKSRAHTTPVTMEPELAFLMANLAKVGSPGRSSTAVLDPCCGSGGLLRGGPGSFGACGSRQRRVCVCLCRQ